MCCVFLVMVVCFGDDDCGGSDAVLQGVVRMVCCSGLTGAVGSDGCDSILVMRLTALF